MNRRDALRIAMGMGDRVALEREQQSAIDVVRAGKRPEPAEDSQDPPAPPRSRLARIGARLKALRPSFLTRATRPER